MNLENKIAPITGGTHGIGAATALQLAAEGVQVCLVTRNTSNSAIVKDIATSNGKCIMIEADLSNPEECVRAVDQTVEQLGGRPGHGNAAIPRPAG